MVFYCASAETKKVKKTWKSSWLKNEVHDTVDSLAAERKWRQRGKISLRRSFKDAGRCWAEVWCGLLNLRWSLITKGRERRKLFENSTAKCIYADCRTTVRWWGWRIRIRILLEVFFKNFGAARQRRRREDLQSVKQRMKKLFSSDGKESSFYI